eukprot:CAMPEP_0117486978 /NCGR_PEP_ID=MMETSP0784-20121206/15759_1 /TAXON_ID=39447 /ORGANISM="" /LENGTH=122 /DNA_ID=CAMNT_0005281613 /DNA_START=80 /DNA_END=448 /DNA_ORIENTATION=+
MSGAGSASHRAADGFSKPGNRARRQTEPPPLFEVGFTQILVRSFSVGEDRPCHRKVKEQVRQRRELFEERLHSALDHDAPTLTDPSLSALARRRSLASCSCAPGAENQARSHDEDVRLVPDN